MSGLVDSDTGLAFGDSLIWTDAIGGAGLTIVTSNVVGGELFWGTDALMWGALILTWGTS